MLVDEIEVNVRAGKGGMGKMSFGKIQYSGPDGGNGGKGGDIYFVGTDDIYALNQFTQSNDLAAQNGEDGGHGLRHGGDGNDLEITLPIGTVVYNQANNEIVTEILTKDERFLIARGGVGGKGNYEYRSSTNTTPTYAQWGEKGEEYSLKLVLKLIAQVGLIGLPNSGKSSLLNELTNANAKIGNYNFTTLSPNLGVMDGVVLADIPGLIEGASGGKGLGISFLKHIEKVNVLVHCLSAESSDPKKDYQVIRKELGAYNKTLLKKPEILLITKSDLVDKPTLTKIIKAIKIHKPIPVSIHDWESVEGLKKAIGGKIQTKCQRE